MVQWLRLYASTTRDTGLIPSLGTKIPHATYGTTKKTKQNKAKQKQMKRQEESDKVIKPIK